jgi:hypothetical protein
MRFRRFHASIALAMWLTGVQSAHAQQPAPSDSTRAVTAARNWLTVVDSARWQMSLDSASDLFRRIVGSPANWQQFATTARSRYPVNDGRKLATWEASFTPEGAPDVVTHVPPSIRAVVRALRANPLCWF